MKNEKVISEFEKLVKQISHEIENETDKKKRTVDLFRLKQIGNALNILKKYPRVIKSGKDLTGIKGIGKGIINRIDEIFDKGVLSEITLKTKDINESDSIEELKEVFGIGDKKAHELVTKHNIKSIAELKKAFSKGKINLNSNVIMGLKYEGVYKQQIPRDEMKRMEKYIQNVATQIDDELEVKICGSFRRKKPFSNDIDCMLSHPKIKTQSNIKNKRNYLREFIEALKDDLFIVDALTSGDVETKFMGFCQFSKKLPVRRIDIRYVPYNSYYTALLYFTGSGSFNQNMRQNVKKLGYKLNEYGLYKKTGDTYKNIKISSEEDIFEKMGFDYVVPEKRV
jgi:DNA polymerase beta